MGHFWAPNQYFWSFPKIFLLDLPEIVPHDKDLKVDKCDCFGFLTKILIISKISDMGHFLSKSFH